MFCEITFRKTGLSKARSSNTHWQCGNLFSRKAYLLSSRFIWLLEFHWKSLENTKYNKNLLFWGSRREERLWIQTYTRQIYRSRVLDSPKERKNIIVILLEEFILYSVIFWKDSRQSKNSSLTNPLRHLI